VTGAGTGEATAEGMRRQVRRLHLATFRREPGDDGLRYRVAASWWGTPHAIAADHFAASAEFRRATEPAPAPAP